MTIKFKKFTYSDLPLWEKWQHVPHVKNSWFLEGYEPPEKILNKIAGNGYDYPFVIYLGDKAIGFIQYCDLDVYRIKHPNKDWIYKNDSLHSFGIDLFIGEEDCLNKGYGTEAIKKFTQYIFDNFDCKQILIDPSVDNKAAIRCYEKAGFKFLRYDKDKVEENYVMHLLR